jgi:DNA primase
MAESKGKAKSPAIELEVEERTVRISNPDRVYFPARGETKLDLVKYYLSVGDGIVRRVAGAAVHVAPVPEGVSRREGAQKRCRMARRRGWRPCG